ncbi:ABC transporter substrate-binding protein [Sciscionella sediminilitoris]|uniref:ABC transporter substrate-binding protein n=1 Tax=Sciscionella sediminilitoris TaxID=1445613 RepID=UPI0004DF30E8|nr:ABC transporter substrate-binding protein [Sciscionella sp. SE31]
MTFTSLPDREISPVLQDLSRRRVLRLSAATGAGIAVGVPALSGCSLGSAPANRPSSPPPGKPTGVLRIANNAEPQSLDPTIVSNIADLGILKHNIYESLVHYRTGTNKLEPQLAESYESSPDTREWIFRLRRGVKFHDGSDFTSASVKASFEYAKNSGGSTGRFLPDNATYDVSDPHVLRVTMPTPFPDMARNVAAQKLLSPKLLAAGESAIKQKPAGTGPFRFVSYRTAQSVILEANPDYWQHGGGPYLERLEFLIIPDQDSRIAALRSGSVDLVLQLTPTDSVTLQGDPNMVVTRNQAWTTSRLFLFTKTPPMDNVKLRQALACAIDRQALIKSVLRGVGGKPSNSWVAPGVYGYQEPTDANTYDPDRARKLIAESGLRTPVPITIAFSKDVIGPGEQLAQAISGMAKKVGIDLTVLSKPGGELTKVMTNQAPGPRPWHGMVGTRTFVTGGAAHCIALKCLPRENQLDDPQITDLGKQVLNTPDGPARERLFEDIENRVAGLEPVITLYAQTALNAHRANVRGFVPPQDGLIPEYRSVYLSR